MKKIQKRLNIAVLSTLRKLPWVIAYFVLNAIAYFYLIHITEHSISFYVTGIDDKIPFEPYFVWVYLSLFPVMVYTLLWELRWHRGFRRTLLSYFIFVLLSSVFYVLIPSVYPVPPAPNDAGVSGIVISWIHSFDHGNTFPSGHTAFSLLTLMAIWREAGSFRRFAYSIWFILILASTLLLKQHYIVDLLSGIVVAILCKAIAKYAIFILHKNYKRQKRIL